LFDAAPATSYPERLAFVAARRIALWDVCELGEREASADSTIRGERPNAIDRLLDAHPLIRAPYQPLKREIRYLADQWNNSLDQRIRAALTIE